MTTTAEDFAACCESMRGSRWRLHGRTPSIGLDCAGLVIAAAQEVGIAMQDSRDYDARMPAPELLWGLCTRNGESFGLDDQGTGRVGLCSIKRGGPARHLVVMLDRRRIVHVDSSVRRVTVVPASWTEGRLLSVWRVRGLEYGAPWPA